MTTGVDFSPFMTLPPRDCACLNVSHLGSVYPMTVWVMVVSHRFTPRYGFMLSAFMGSPMPVVRHGLCHGGRSPRSRSSSIRSAISSLIFVPFWSILSLSLLRFRFGCCK